MTIDLKNYDPALMQGAQATVGGIVNTGTETVASTETVTGTFSVTGASTLTGAVTASAGVTVTGAVSATTTIKSSGPTSGIGYATGAGLAVSQATDRTTGVTINAVCGTITTQATSLAALARVRFVVTNSAVAIGDVIVLSIQSGPTTTGATIALVDTVAAGSFGITLYNSHATVADTGAAIINFAVVKAVSA